MKNLTLIAALFAFALGACERHDWEETKVFYEHGDHGDKGHHGEEKEGEKGHGEEGHAH
ncbi:MAG: hypothetical protein ACQKBY_13350 [Verrucomicrobiales bacterium]